MLNAATDREFTVYYAKVARPHLDLPLDVLVDLLRGPLFDPEEMEKERKVVLEELASVVDSPGQQVDLLLDELLWPDQPLGWDVAGTKEIDRGDDARDAPSTTWRASTCPATSSSASPATSITKRS